MSAPAPIVMPQPKQPKEGLIGALRNWQLEPVAPLHVRAEVHIDLFLELVRLHDERTALRQNWLAAQTEGRRRIIEDRASTVAAQIAEIESEMSLMGIPANIHQESPAVRRAQALASTEKAA